MGTQRKTYPPHAVTMYAYVAPHSSAAGHEASVRSARAQR